MSSPYRDDPDGSITSSDDDDDDDHHNNNNRANSAAPEVFSNERLVSMNIESSSEKYSKNKKYYNWFIVIWCKENPKIAATVNVAIFTCLLLFLVGRGKHKDQTNDNVINNNQGIISNPDLWDSSTTTSDCEVESGETFQELLKRYEEMEFSIPCEDQLQKSNHACDCNNPTYPRKRQSLKAFSNIEERWDAGFNATLDVIKNASNIKNNLDLVMVGDSITEHWLGTSTGTPKAPFTDIVPVYESIFTRAKGGKIDGIPLGISGDRMHGLMYRIHNGNAPPDLNPKVWWVLIGTNDLSPDHCTTESIVAGNIAIVQALRQAKPSATIVVNSILPRSLTLLWPFVQEVNKQLECFSNEAHGVEYFDATDIFLNSETMELQNLQDGLHPSVEGSKVWGAAIVKKVQEIIIQKKL